MPCSVLFSYFHRFFLLAGHHIFCQDHPCLLAPVSVLRRRRRFANCVLQRRRGWFLSSAAETISGSEFFHRFYEMSANTTG